MTISQSDKRNTKRINPKSLNMPDVMVHGGIVKENLPYPYVHYPFLCGIFFTFSETPISEPMFCECSRVPIENYFKLMGIVDTSRWKETGIKVSLSRYFFPSRISVMSLDTPLSELYNFKPKLCHRCNMATPTYRYCHEMYGGNFEQYYGWYINQTYLRLGISHIYYYKDFKRNYVEDYTPNNLIDELNDLKFKIDTRNNLVKDYDSLTDEEVEKEISLDKEISKLRRKINRNVENITRVEFGFRKVGEGNVSEMILTKIVEKIYSTEVIFRHHRPDWLHGLELDIYIPNLKLAFEYQGQQHFFPIKAWGGEKALEKVQNRDLQKKTICQSEGVQLITVDFTESLTEEHILDLIQTEG